MVRQFLIQASVAILVVLLISQISEFVVNLLIDMPNFSTVYYRYIFPTPLVALPKILRSVIVLVVSLCVIIWVVSKQTKREDNILDDL